MNRKEFFAKLWTSVLKPILVIAALYFCIRFIIEVIAENGPERLLTIAVAGFIILFAIVSLIGLVFRKALYAIYVKLSPTIQFYLKVLQRIYHFITPFIAGALLYHFWQKDWFIASSLMGYLLVQSIADIVKEEKKNRQINPS